MGGNAKHNRSITTLIYIIIIVIVIVIVIITIMVYWLKQCNKSSNYIANTVLKLAG